MYVKRNIVLNNSLNYKYIDWLKLKASFYLTLQRFAKKLIKYLHTCIFLVSNAAMAYTNNFRVRIATSSFIV